jgi:tripartite-type tricarboxylate transporter receptor subunit TctC
LKWVTAHYRGNAPATTDLIAGHVNFNFDQVSVALPYIKDGQTRALGVTGQKRSGWVPDVPTFAEQGHPEIEGATFTGLMAPAKTPDAIVARLNAETRKILSDPQVKAKYEAIGADTAPMSVEEFRRYLEKEEAIWLPVIRQAGIKVQ